MSLGWHPTTYFQGVHITMDPEIEAALSALTDAAVGSRGRVTGGNAARLPSQQTSLLSLARFAEADDVDGGDAAGGGKTGSGRGDSMEPTRASESDPMRRLQQVQSSAMFLNCESRFANLHTNAHPLIHALMMALASSRK